MNDKEFLAFLSTLKGVLDSTTELSNVLFKEVSEVDWKEALWADKKITEVYELIKDKIEALSNE